MNVKLPRPDLTSLALTALCVVAIVVLSLQHIAIPDVLTYVAVGALGVGGGTALNSSSSGDQTAARIAAAVGALEQLLGGRGRGPVIAPRAAPAAAVVPAPAPASATS